MCFWCECVSACVAKLARAHVRYLILPPVAMTKQTGLMLRGEDPPAFAITQIDSSDSGDLDDGAAGGAAADPEDLDDGAEDLDDGVADPEVPQEHNMVTVHLMHCSDLGVLLYLLGCILYGLWKYDVRGSEKGCVEELNHQRELTWPSTRR